MPRVTFNRMSKKKSYVRKRRTSVVTRSKFQKPTARNQKSQIMDNAYAIRTLRRLVGPAVYTDWQYSSGQSPLLSVAPNPYFGITSAELMSPNLWNGVLRQDDNVTDASSTLVKRMQINLRYSLGASNWCQITCFVVSIRKDAANRVINQAGLTAGEDYIFSQNAQDYNFNPRLNSNVFKVHYVRNISLTAGVWLENAVPAGGTNFSGNPQTTFAKGQVNMNLNYRIRQSVQGLQWRDMTQAQFAPSQRLFLLTFFKGKTNEPDDNPPRVDWDAQYTCYNAS